jgi:hypothetical protein
LELFCSDHHGYPREPASVTLDIDDTCDVVHGHQQLSLFNAHYDERCFLPIHVYDTEKSRPVAVVLRPGKTPGGVEVRAHLRRLVRHIRTRWHKTRITFRGDGHYARPEAMTWCENNGIDYIFGLSGTKPLARKAPFKKGLAFKPQCEVRAFFIPKDGVSVEDRLIVKIDDPASVFSEIAL